MQHNSSSFGVLFTKFSMNFPLSFFKKQFSRVLTLSESVNKKTKQSNNNTLVKIIFSPKQLKISSTRQFPFDEFSSTVLLNSVDY